MKPSPLTVAGGLDFPLLPRRLHRSPDSEQLSDLQAAARPLGSSQLLQLRRRVEASLSRGAELCPCWRSHEDTRSVSILHLKHHQADKGGYGVNKSARGFLIYEHAATDQSETRTCLQAAERFILLNKLKATPR